MHEQKIFENKSTGCRLKDKKLTVRSSVRRQEEKRTRGAPNPNLHHTYTVRTVGSFVQTSTKNAVECRSHNLITLVWTFYHSLSDYAWFDFLSLKLTQSTELVEQEHHICQIFAVVRIPQPLINNISLLSHTVLRRIHSRCILTKIN